MLIHDAPPMRIGTMEKPSLVKTVGENIRELRTQRGMSQDDLARAMGASSGQTISQAERGSFAPSLQWLERCAEALQIDPSELFEKQGIVAQ